MKRLIGAIVGLCLIASSAVGFYQSRDSNYNQNVVSGGGGGGIAFDAASSFDSGGALPGATATWSHTCNSCSALAVFVTWFNGSAALSGVTYNGVALTPHATTTFLGGLESIQIWGSDGFIPASGTHNIVVTLASSGQFVSSGGMSVTGSNTTTTFTNTNAATATSTTPSVSVTSNSGELTVDFVSNGGGNTTFTPGGLQTSRISPFAGGSGFASSGSSLPSNATSTTMSWTVPSEEWAIVAGSFKQ